MVTQTISWGPAPIFLWETFSKTNHFENAGEAPGRHGKSIGYDSRKAFSIASSRNRAVATSFEKKDCLCVGVVSQQRTHEALFCLPSTRRQTLVE